MKKIQVTTVEQTAQVQVINLNSYLVANAVRVMLSMKHALAGTRTQVMTKSEDGEKDVPAMENGKPVYDYNKYKFEPEDIKELHETVLPFLEELCEAFEEDE